MTPRDTLNKAADLIDARGWHQGGYCGPDGGVCCLAAVDIVSRHALLVVTEAAELLCRRVGAPDPAGLPRNKVVAWNDAPGRTQAEVTSMLRGEA